VVIGGGSAGLVAVDFGGPFGARGLLLESGLRSIGAEVNFSEVMRRVQDAVAAVYSLERFGARSGSCGGLGTFLSGGRPFGDGRLA